MALHMKGPILISYLFLSCSHPRKQFGWIFLYLVSLLTCSKSAIGDENRISSVSSFFSFVNSVNSKGTNFNGTTVYLDSDLSLLGFSINPIGTSSSNQFLGVFDGQGHTISDLNMISSSQYTGLFGYSEGITIRNVILDSSCSITSTYSGSNYAFVGGFIGHCKVIGGERSIENNVNMADISFIGDIHSDNYLTLGGVTGYFESPGHVKNCANYGPVTHSGTTKLSFIGGLVGYLYDYVSNYSYVSNSINYGAITHDGTTDVLYIGSIVGHSYKAYISNCVSAGKIDSNNDTYVGIVVGVVNSKTTFDGYCAYTSDVEVSGMYGLANSSISLKGYISFGSSSISSSTVTTLNGYASEWNKWLFNENNAIITFKTNANEGFSLSSSLIILPNLASDWRNFVGWFTDSSFTTPFSETSVSESTTLYGRWETYSVTFEANGGNVSETFKNVTYNNVYGELPEANRTGYTFLGWFTEKDGGEEVTSSTTFTSLFDNTIYARWTINNYTLTFILGNGNEDDARVLNYSQAFVYPADPEKEGYTFNGWNNNDIEFMPAGDITVTAEWTPNNYTVTFDGNGGNVSKASKIVTFNKKYGKLPGSNKIGHTFSGWFTDKNVRITDETIVTIANNHILHALYTPNNYSVKFVCGNKIICEHLMTYNTSIEYKGENPTKAFHKFDSWCIENGKDCLPKQVPAGNITFYAHFTIDPAAVSGTAVGSFVGAILLVFLVIVLVVVILILKKGMKIGHEAVDVEMSQTNATERNKENESRIIKHMDVMSISNGTVNKLEKCPQNKKKDRVLNEVFDDLGVDYNDNPYGISESFKMKGVVDAIVNNLQNNTNLAATGSYLSLLLAAVREQEDFETFEKLYFGMKDVNKFIHAKKDEGIIRFEGIVTGFTDKLMVIQLLSEGEEDNLPRGVLFKIQNGKGYNVESQGEVLFELNSVFSIEKMEEVIRDRYIVVKLSYTSPNSEDEMVSI